MRDRKGKEMFNLINVKNIMHANTKYHVSPTAIREYSIRIIEHLENYTPLLTEIAKKDGRKTILDRDVVELFGFVENTIAGEGGEF